MEWHSELPDGRDVVIRRSGNDWVVRCGHAGARSENLDVALAQAIRADTEDLVQADDIHYAVWVRDLAEELARAS